MNKLSLKDKLELLDIVASEPIYLTDTLESLTDHTSGKINPAELIVVRLESTSSTMDVANVLSEFHFSPEILSVLNAKAISFDRSLLGYSKAIVISASQTKGRGRANKSWESEKDKGLYFTMQLELDKPVENLGCVALVVGIALRNCLSSLNIDCSLKWPNDLVVVKNNTIFKLAGILVESKSIGGITRLNIGVGVNTRSACYTGFLATSIEQCLGKIISTNDLIRPLFVEISRCLNHYFESGFCDFVSQFRQANILSGRTVMVDSPNGNSIVSVIDINTDGSLLVSDNTGATVNIYAGEVSIINDSMY